MFFAAFARCILTTFRKHRQLTKAVLKVELHRQSRFDRCISLCKKVWVWTVRNPMLFWNVRRKSSLTAYFTYSTAAGCIDCWRLRSCRWVYTNFWISFRFWCALLLLSRCAWRPFLVFWSCNFRFRQKQIDRRDFRKNQRYVHHSLPKKFNTAFFSYFR